MKAHWMYLSWAEILPGLGLGPEFPWHGLLLGSSVTLHRKPVICHGNGWHASWGPSSCCGLWCTAKTELASLCAPLGMVRACACVPSAGAPPVQRTFPQLLFFWSAGSAGWMFAHHWMETSSSFALEQFALRGLQPSEFPQGSIYLWRDPIRSYSK